MYIKVERIKFVKLLVYRSNERDDQSLSFLIPDAIVEYSKKKHQSFTKNLRIQRKYEFEEIKSFVKHCELFFSRKRLSLNSRSTRYGVWRFFKIGLNFC